MTSANHVMPNFKTKVEELTFLIQRIETRLELTRTSYRKRMEECLAPELTSPRSRLTNLAERLRRKSLEDDQKDDPTAHLDSPAKFVCIENAAELIEDLRRVSELVIIGENYITRLEKKEKEDLKKSKEKWSSFRDGLDGIDLAMDESTEADDDKNLEMTDHVQLFDLFFERNTLETIVDMITGDAFGVEPPEPPAIDDDNVRPPVEFFQGVLLPSVPIATQAIQSISILVQNVSRAVSLYTILANNVVNKLIQLPIHLYSEAVKTKLQGNISEPVHNKTFSSPEVSELTTHFITTLKSLALRMNSETLQFFLTYPDETEHQESSHYFRAEERTSNDISYAEDDDEMEPPSLSIHEAKAPVDNDKPTTAPSASFIKNVEFPLYERALEFCAAHHESFVRVTALNICLNTLRLTTVSPADGDESVGDAEKAGSSPDGVLHNAKPLLFRERLGIALHTCAPSRVERLIAPIFTKLAERWADLDEAIRAIDCHRGCISRSQRVDKVFMAKEKVKRERLIRAFRDKADNLQDEMLLMEDVFKVGLTVLNEQMIEMMFATFVYPLLLQPLLLFHQRFHATVDEHRANAPDHPFRGFAGDFNEAKEALVPVFSPAKASLFTLSSAFQLLTNKPLLRLLFTALLHPLCPDSSSVPTVRSSLQVAAMDRNGNKTIRLDEYDSGDGNVAIERSSYAFGTTPGNRRLTLRNPLSLETLEGTEACVFVLSPALAEVLEFRGDDIALITRTRPNPYRQAILTCLYVPDDLNEITRICVSLFESVSNVLEGKFVSDVLFGADLKTFADDMPVDERNLESTMAHEVDDRGIGGGVRYESRQALSRHNGGTVGSDLVGEVTTALCQSTFYAMAVRDQSYALEFDLVAARALLAITRWNGKAMITASKFAENRWRQAAVFMARRPLTIHQRTGGFALGSKASSSDDFDEQMYGNVANLLFFDAPDDPGHVPIVETFERLENTAAENVWSRASLVIAQEGSFRDLCDRVGGFLMHEIQWNPEDRQGVQLGRICTATLFKVNALLSLMKNMAATGGIGVQRVDLSGCALAYDGSFVDLTKSMALDLKRVFYALLEDSLVDVVFSGPEVPDSTSLENGATLNFMGELAIPCVIEAPAALAHLFVDALGVEAEGVTWQSLFLLCYQGFLVFLQPIGDSAEEGRVVAAVALERLSVEQDKEDVDSPARRLILTYRWFSHTPPPLFLFDVLPATRKHGPLERIEPCLSRLDVWFEDQRAADTAFQLLSMNIFESKSARGNRLQKCLFPNTQLDDDCFQ